MTPYTRDDHTYYSVVLIQKRPRCDSYFIQTSHIISRIGDFVLAILGKDRILFTNLDSELGKQKAVQILRGRGWNVKKVKVVKQRDGSVRYTIPKPFFNALGLKRGYPVLLTGREGQLEVIPIKVVLNMLGTFKERTLY